MRCFYIGHVFIIPLGEDQIDFLKRAVRGLGVEEVDEGQEARVDGGEEEVGAPADAGDHDGGHHYDEEVDGPVDDVGECGAFGADAERVDFGGVEPGDC